MPLRYVILRHEQIDPPHFDLMFETSAGSPLSTWRSDAWPIAHPTPLLHLPDHRPHYLTYEGPLSANRGTVRQVDSGRIVYHSRSATGAQVMLQNDSGTIVLKLTLAQGGEPHWLACPVGGA